LVTIIGSGIGDYDFSRISVDLSSFDKVICDKNFKEDLPNLIKLSFKEAKEYILANRDKNIAYIVTGSPFFYSAASIILKYIPGCKIIDNTSSIQYLINKLYIPLEKISFISLHGRREFDLKECLNKEYTFFLCDQYSMDRLREIFRWVREEIETFLGYKMGYKDEVIKKIDLFNCDFDTSKPYVILVKRNFKISNESLQDEDFEKERGMITKKYKRELSLSHLSLSSNQLFWDVGAGSGSCAIEAFVKYRVRTTLFEKNPLRAKMIENNLKRHKVLASKLLVGRAEEFFEKESERPDRILVGGGGEGVIEKLPFLYEILKEGGIMLINIISLRHLSKAIDILDRNAIAYDVVSLSLTTYKNSLKMSEPERELFWIKIEK